MALRRLRSVTGRVHQISRAGSDSGSTAALHAASQGSTPCRSTSLRRWPCGVEVSTALFHGADSGALPDKAAIKCLDSSIGRAADS